MSGAPSARAVNLDTARRVHDLEALRDVGGGQSSEVVVQRETDLCADCGAQLLPEFSEEGLRGQGGRPVLAFG
jgi:hypothetical protein